MPIPFGGNVQSSVKEMKYVLTKPYLLVVEVRTSSSSSSVVVVIIIVCFWDIVLLAEEGNYNRYLVSFSMHDDV